MLYPKTLIKLGPFELIEQIRVPRPAYLRSQLFPRGRPDAVLYEMLARLAELYELGEIQTYTRPSRSNSLNFIVTTQLGKFVVRRHRLSETSVAYEHEVLDYLQRRNFPAPRMLINQAGRAWTELAGALYSVYEFVAGYCPANYFWWPTTRRNIIAQCGRILGEYHAAVADLTPSGYKWSAYQPTGRQRWCDGDWFRGALADIRPALQKPSATSPIDDFARARLDDIDRMLRLESVVEECSDLSKLVIHGDFAPWNILFHPGRSPFLLDFNEARLDLKIYDIVIATFWFAWRDGHLDQARAMLFQTAYCETGQVNESDLKLASPVFRWIMARSLTERLYKHYLGQRRLTKGPAGLERQCKWCEFADQQPQQLVAGLAKIMV